ncbi:hypothetical protein F5Y06DRAFT_201956 [Hypoxylon sp. FL0890]|nr:hypothetical protein F5Y06DRAFT_201956 [Hypoxylon sp. FL0890]
MAEYATTAIAAMTATAAIVSSSAAHRQQERAFRANKSDENSPWQQRQRPPFASTRSRHSYGYYGQQLYYPATIHEHYEHHFECPGSQCHYRAFLMDSIQRYNESRRNLRQTYVWNLRELSRIHKAQPQKPNPEKEAEIDRLYTYYVSRVRDVFEEHRRDHRRLFGQDYLCWAPPEREDPLQLQMRSRCGSKKASRRESRSTSGDGGNMIKDATAAATATNATAPMIAQRRESGSDCEKGGHRPKSN